MKAYRIKTSQIGRALFCEECFSELIAILGYGACLDLLDATEVLDQVYCYRCGRLTNFERYHKQEAHILNEQRL